MRKLILIAISFLCLIILFFCKSKSKEELVLVQANHDFYYDKGSKLVMPHIETGDTTIIIDKKAKEDITEGLKYLDAVTKINPANFAAFWIKGKAYQSLKQHDSAYAQFDNSFELNKDNPDVARELMIECLYLGKAERAIEVSLHALSLDSLNAGLTGNLALSYLIGGELDSAGKTIDKAVNMDPADKINVRLQQIIKEVSEGKRNRPVKYDDIQL